MRPCPAILILAAGASSRMRGRDKLLEEIDGTPLILRAVRAACAVSAEVVVALPKGDRTRSAWLTDSPARLLPVESRAMSASIAAGAAVVAADALMIHLCDMPEIDQAALQTVASAWQAHHADLMQATTPDGRPGHPTVFHRTHFPSLHGLTGDRGAREILKAGAVAPCVLPGLAAVTDLDTPEDWAAWRAENSR